jgi:hypothetical protein
MLQQSSSTMSESNAIELVADTSAEAKDQTEAEAAEEGEERFSETGSEMCANIIDLMDHVRPMRRTALSLSLSSLMGHRRRRTITFNTRAVSPSPTQTVLTPKQVPPSTPPALRADRPGVRVSTKPGATEAVR